MLALSALLFMFIFLLFPQPISELGRESLLIWYQTILPVLFPMMVCTQIICPYLTGGRLVHPFWHWLAGRFSVPPIGLFVLLSGFVCGFPIGSYLCRQLLEQGELELNDAQHLMHIANNLSPAYLWAVALTDLPKSEKIAGLCIVYGVPILWGLITKPTRSETSHLVDSKHKLSRPKASKELQPKTSKDLDAISLKQAIENAIHRITLLGGYIFMTRCLLLFPQFLEGYFPRNGHYFSTLFSAMMEITSGIEELKQLAATSDDPLLLRVPFLVYGGFASVMQTAAMIAGTSLSIKKYTLHKAMQAMLAGILCIMVQSF